MWRQGVCGGKGRAFFISAASRSEIRIGFESLNSMPWISELGLGVAKPNPNPNPNPDPHPNSNLDRRVRVRGS